MNTVNSTLTRIKIGKTLGLLESDKQESDLAHVELITPNRSNVANTSPEDIHHKSKRINDLKIK